MGELENLLKSFTSGGTAPQSDSQDLSKVAQGVPPAVLSSGIADAFRSDQTPPFGQMISQLFSQSNPDQRAGILNHLLSAAGPSLLSGGAAGGLLGSLGNLIGGNSTVTPEQAQQVSPQAVQQLAEHAQQQNPSIVDQAGAFYSQHPALVQGLGAAALALIMSRVSRSR